jgi:hypothetical protein
MGQTEEIDDEFDEDEKPGPSLAYPPLYVLRAVTYCPECGQTQHVYSLGCAAYNDAEDGEAEPIYDFHFLRCTESVPDRVMRLLKARCPGFYLDQEERGGRPYLMNHCRCGARLDDDFVSGDVGAAFWPATPDGYGDLKLFLLPVEDAIPIESNYMLGGGENLNLDDAEPW